MRFIQKIFTAALFLFAAFIHAYRFWEWGTEGKDAIFYQRMGLLWAEGRFDLRYLEATRPFVRPMIFGLSGLFYKFFGIHDYTFKILNLVSLFGSLVLMLLIARRRKIQPPFAACALLIYLFLPAVILQTRTELSHLLSAFFVLLGFFFLDLFRERRKYAALVLSALALHGAAAVHPDLVLLVPGFLLLIFLDARASEEKGLERAVPPVLVFSAAFLIPYLFYLLLWDPGFILKSLHANQMKPQVVQGKHFPVLALEFMSKGMVSLLGLPLTVLLYSAVAFQLYGKYRSRNKEALKNLDLLIPAALYFFLFDLLIKRNVLSPLIRLLIPLIPFAALYAAARLQSWSSGGGRLRKPALFFLLFLALLFNFKNYRQLPSFAFYSEYSELSFLRFQTVFRHIHDRMRGMPGPGEKILIAPSSFFDNLETFNLPFYFDGRSVHLSECSPYGENFKDFLARHRVRYLFVGPERFRMKDDFDRRLRHGLSPCLVSASDYDAELEIERLFDELEPFEPEKVYEDPYFGAVYKLKESVPEKSSEAEPE